MSMSNAFEDDFLKLIFNGTAIANIADNAAASPLTSLYLTLHVADPGEGGNQSTNEVAYTGYARVAVIRTTSGWSVSGGIASPVATIEFGEMTAGTSGVATYASIGTASSGAGKILFSGAISPTIPFQVGTVPRLRTTSTITAD